MSIETLFRFFLGELCVWSDIKDNISERWCDNATYLLRSMIRNSILRWLG